MLFSHSPVVTVFFFYFKILSFSLSLNVWGSLLTYLHDSYSTSLMSGSTGWPKHASHFFWLSPITGYTPCSLYMDNSSSKKKTGHQVYSYLLRLTSEQKSKMCISLYLSTDLKSSYWCL